MTRVTDEATNTCSNYPLVTNRKHLFETITRNYLGLPFCSVIKGIAEFKSIWVLAMTGLYVSFSDLVRIHILRQQCCLVSSACNRVETIIYSYEGSEIISKFSSLIKISDKFADKFPFHPEEEREN